MNISVLSLPLSSSLSVMVSSVHWGYAEWIFFVATIIPAAKAIDSIAGSLFSTGPLIEPFFFDNCR